MSYLTIENRASDEFEEKKSVFIGHIKRTETEEEAKEFVNEIKNQYKDARHNVYAYVIGENAGIQRYSDDGEPKGTGGIPVLDVIKKNNLRNVTIVVTRYFGGILLGAGGLTRAYSKGASVSIKAGGIVEKVIGVPIKIELPYDLLGKVQYISGTNNWYIEDTQYTDQVELLMYCEKEKLEMITKTLINETAAKVVISEGDEGFFFKKGDRLIR
ncbi:YigZ family protein [Oceanirhabdus sp. W0125-5]|uniref:YigZ family protein n=1 Tax=Oceanirhabdus sp. W0125-5 TaxID=2999116 RepID=UPI0022F338A9|nr:YigZ family protein [Oceanirhabdus sp. W0125-5]WBW99479.1 YigZ family protein [Oceanirhabdus sp. W0125-5]